MFRALDKCIQKVEERTSDIPRKRKTKLQTIADYIQEKRRVTAEFANLIFICTHNSRRSLLCQIWAAALACYYDIEPLGIFSGGTKAADFHPHAVAAAERAGFKVEKAKGCNSHYRVFFDAEAEPIACFSKTYDDSSNPHKYFAAIMTCAEADQNCPVIPGASLRVSLPYGDPKEADGTPEETLVYDERCRQIATEMVYLISQVKL